MGLGSQLEPGERLCWLGPGNGKGNANGFGNKGRGTSGLAKDWIGLW